MLLAWHRAGGIVSWGQEVGLRIQHSLTSTVRASTVCSRWGRDCAFRSSLCVQRLYPWERPMRQLLRQVLPVSEFSLGTAEWVRRPFADGDLPLVTLLVNDVIRIPAPRLRLLLRCLYWWSFNDNIRDSNECFLEKIKPWDMNLSGTQSLAPKDLEVKQWWGWG